MDKGLTPGTWKLVTEKHNLSTNETFDFRLRLIDTKGFIVTAMQSLGTEYLPLDLGKFGIGVGRIFDNDTPVDLQVGKGGIDSLGPIRVNGKELKTIEPTPQIKFNIKILNGTEDLNTIVESGIYRLQANHKNIPMLAKWSNMLVMRPGDNNDVISQIIVPLNQHAMIFFRSGNQFGKSWGAWKQIVGTNAAVQQ